MRGCKSPLKGIFMILGWLNLVDCAACGKDHEVYFQGFETEVLVEGALAYAGGWCEEGKRVVFITHTEDSE